jgi:hypothetical protein
MKVAILIPGMLRCFEEVQPEFKKYIIDILNPDIFFSGYPNNKGLQYCESKIKELWNPKKYIIREYTEEFRRKIHPNDEKFEERKVYGSRVSSTLSGKYNIKLANQLRKEYEKKNNIKYDLLMVWRPELVFYKTLEKEEIEKSISGDVLIPDAWDFKEVNPICVSDIGVVTNGDSMDIYASFIDCIDKYWEEGHLFHPETLMGVHLEKTGLRRTGVHYTGWYLYYNLKDRKGF